MSRRELLKSVAGSKVVTAVGIGGLLALLENRQALAKEKGTVIEIVGVTSEAGGRGGPGEPHRHTFEADFRIESINPNTGQIRGLLLGETDEIIFTGSGTEAFHVHQIDVPNLLIGETVPTLLAFFHTHNLHAD